MRNSFSNAWNFWQVVCPASCSSTVSGACPWSPSVERNSFRLRTSHGPPTSSTLHTTPSYPMLRTARRARYQRTLKPSRGLPPSYRAVACDAETCDVPMGVSRRRHNHIEVTGRKVEGHRAIARFNPTETPQQSLPQRQSGFPTFDRSLQSLDGWMCRVPCLRENFLTAGRMPSQQQGRGKIRPYRRSAPPAGPTCNRDSMPDHATHGSHHQSVPSEANRHPTRCEAGGWIPRCAVDPGPSGNSPRRCAE